MIIEHLSEEDVPRAKQFVEEKLLANGFISPGIPVAPFSLVSLLIAIQVQKGASETPLPLWNTKIGGHRPIISFKDIGHLWSLGSENSWDNQ
ncbi:hypothetical protein [Dyadobacter jejuensis]|nr:hypothetical protein [Dyadobacter jejuensis]